MHLPSDPRASGLPLHTRALTVIVSRDVDGGYHAQGDVIDLRKNGCVPSVDDVQPAGIIHAMKIGIDLDPATLRMDRIVVEQPFVAVEPSAATGGESCRDPAPRLVAMAGERLDAEFNRKLSAGFGGPLGCSHLLTSFQLMASCVPLAMAREKERALREGTATAPGTRFFRRSLYIDGQLLPDATIDVVVQSTDTYTRPPSPGNRGFERLVRVHEVKCFAGVERKRFGLERLEVVERERDPDRKPAANAPDDDILDDPWTSHTDFFAPFVGHPMIPGMARRIFDRIGDDPAKHALKDALLQLAPGFIQISAALMDQGVLRRRFAQREAEPASPSVSGIGGMPDSCYMWRRNSPYTLSRREAMLPREKS